MGQNRTKDKVSATHYCWFLASEPGLFEMLVHFPGNTSVSRNEAQEQHSLLDTMFENILYFGPPGEHLYKIKKTYMSAGFADRHVVDCGTQV